jgi:transcriptional regulator with XRE-family HTH domain
MGKRRKAEEVPGLVEQLKEAIRQHPGSLNQLGIASGVDTSQLSRFIRGQRNLSLESAEKLCQFLHLRLTREEGSPPPEGEEPPPAGPTKRGKGKGNAS